MTDFKDPAERVVPTTPSAADEWENREIEPAPEYPVKKERLFSRRVLIGWALFTLVAYFGAKAATTAIRESIREAVRSGAVTPTPGEGVVVRTPNGTRIRIGRRDSRNPGITITRTIPEPTPPVKATTPAADAGTAPAAPPATQATPSEKR